MRNSEFAAPLRVNASSYRSDVLAGMTLGEDQPVPYDFGG